MKYPKITLMMRSLSPLHISSTEEARVNLSKAPRLVRAGSEGQPCTLTRKMTVTLPEPRQTSAGDTYHTVQIPEIPANSIRGRLRRLAARRVFEVLRAKGERLSLDAYHALTCGAVTGQPQGSLSLEDADQGRNHPYFGGFGGGPRMLRSHFTVGTALPVCELTVDQGLIPTNTYSDVGFGGPEFQMTVVIPVVRKDDVLLFSDPQAATWVDDYHQSVADWIEMIGGNKVDRQDEEKSKSKSKSLTSFTAHEIAIPGLTYAAEIRIRPSMCQEAQGLLISALIDFFAEGQIGGKGHNGYGRFAGLLTCADGPIIVDGEPNMDVPWVAEAMDAWAAAESQIGAAEIEHIVRLETPWRKK